MIGIIISFFISIIAGFVQSVAGFGSGVVNMLVFPSVFGMIPATGIANSINFISPTLIVLKSHDKINLKLAVKPMLIYILVSQICIRTIQKLDLGFLKLLFGVFLIFLGTISILDKKAKNTENTENTVLSTIVYSVIAGIGQGWFSIGGPTIAAYFHRATKDKNEFMQNLQFFFIFTSLIAFITRVIKGIYVVSYIKYTIAGALGIYIGLAIGKKAFDKMDGNKVKFATSIVTLVSGVIAIIQAIIALA